MRSFHYIQLIPALLIFFANACIRIPAPHVESFESIEEDSQTSSFINNEEVFWDVSNIDISDVNTNKKLIAFTFDDAPSRTLESILAVFAAYNENNEDCRASATIFFNGYRFNAETTHLLYSACALGFECGNHTYSHADLTSLEEDTLIQEIERTDKLLERTDNQTYHLLRAPFGKTNELVRACTKTPIIDWTIDTLDWTNRSEQEIYDSVFNNRFSGAIVLMHDGYESTVSALKRLLPDLKADGYQVVSVSKMIKAHGCKFRKGSVYIRARKQN